MRRIAIVSLGFAGFLLFLSAIDAQATPIHPDVKKLLATPQEPATQFAPARAGWQGPEAVKAQDSANPAWENLTPESTARAVRKSLLMAAIPDPRLVLVVVIAIVLLRHIRGRRARAAKVQTPLPVELRPAA